MSSIDLAVPAAVVGGCLLIVLLIWWFGRERAPRWSIEPPADEPEIHATVDPSDLAAWHRAHGAAVAAWITAHETVLRRLGHDELAVDRSDPALFQETTNAAPAFTEALGDHPSAGMRAELSAMQVAADATLHAVSRGDYETAERQHLTYVEYRDEWVGRLRQFSLDDPDIAELRRSLSSSAVVSTLPSSDAGVDADAASDDLRLSS